MSNFKDNGVLSSDEEIIDDDIFIPSRRQKRMGITKRKIEYTPRLKIITYDATGKKNVVVYDDKTQIQYNINQ